MLWPCSSEIDDGLSLARQYAGRVDAPSCWNLLLVMIACLYIGTNEEKIIGVLARHDLPQRLQIKSKYTTMFGRV